MPRARITRRDDNAPHQIRLVNMANHMTGVQCTCRPHTMLATITPTEDPWPHYNNARHDNTKERFISNVVNSTAPEVFHVE